MKRIIVSLIALIVSIFLLSSCATITLDSSTLLEPAQLNNAGTLDFTIIDSFSVDDKAGWIIGIVPVNLPAGGNHDYFKTILDKQIKRVNGEGVINVKIQSQLKILDFLTWIVPIYTTRTVTISGDIIKYD